MPTHHFTLIVDGADLQDEFVVNSLFESGCDDALFGSTDGVQFIDFDRNAAGWDEAVLSTVADVERVDGVKVIRVSEGSSAPARLKSLTREGPDREERKHLLEEILLILNRCKVRATYNAVACILGIAPRNLGKLLGRRRPWASWVVSKGDGEPTGYENCEKHPDLYSKPEWMKSCCKLRECLKRPLPIGSQHADGCDGGC